MKRLILIAALCLYAIPLMAVTYGAGSDLPHNITVNGVSMPLSGTPTSVPSYLGGFNSQQVCWDTTTSSDSLLEIDYSVNGYSAPTVFRQFYDATMVTHHCVEADLLLPGKTYLANVASCGTAGTGGTSPLRCSRTDMHWSIAPEGNGQSNGIQFTMPTTNPAHTLAWQFIPVGPYQNSGDGEYQGHAFNVDLIGLWQDGPAPAYIMVTSLTVDGSSCTAALTGATCGSTHVKVVIDSAGNAAAESVNPATNNYSVTVMSTGTYAGKFAIGGNVSTIMSGIFTQPGAMMRVITDGSTALGSHTVAATFQATNPSQATMGSPVTMPPYTFYVQAPASFTVVPPTTFPAIPSLATWDVNLAKNAPAKFNLVQTDNLTLGEYNNDNMGAVATAFDPWASMNYSGERVAFQFADYMASVTAAPRSSHAYNLGDKLCTSEPSTNCTTNPNFVQIVTTAGSSTAFRATWNETPGGTTTWGTAVFTNAGNVAYWNQMAQRILMPTLDWALYMPRIGSWMEWNPFLAGTEMDYFREGGALSENCNGSGSCAGLQAKALAYFVSPLISTPGIATQGIVGSYKFTPPGTVRNLPYSLDLLIYNHLVRGAPVVNGAVDEEQARLDLTLQTWNEIEHCNPVSVGNGITCLLSTPSFDIGLTLEAVIHLYTVEAYEYSLGHGPAPDARIPIEVKKIVDWTYSHEYNQFSNNSMPYTLWIIPTNSNMYNWTANVGLNNLVAPGLAWLQTMYGDSCTLPTSGTGCWTAADAMFGHTLDIPFSSQKQLNQAYKWWPDYLGWRQGWMTGAQSIILPTFNPNHGLIPDKMEPFNAGDYPRITHAVSLTANSATIQWYTFKATTATQVRYGTSFSLLGSPVVCGPGTYVSGSDALWLNSCAISGLASNTNYTFGVGATDALGNTAFSAQNPDQSGTYLNFTTINGGVLVITGPSSCPNGYQSSAYAGCFPVASGGVLPYTWSISAGSLPTGLTLNSSTGAITGTPSAHGNFPFTVAVTDSTTPTHQVTSQAYSSTIFYPVLVVTTSSCPSGTVGVAYAGCSQTYSGGNGTNTWSVISGSLPYGLTLNPSTGAITGTPTISGGTFVFTVQASDSETPPQTAIQSESITIAAPASLVITSTTCPNGVVGTPYSCTMTATGGTTPYTWAVTPVNGGFGACAPGLVTIGSSSGAFSGTPTAAGYCAIGVTVTDAAGSVYLQSITITVPWPTLTMTTPSCPNGVVGLAYNCNLAATGGNGNYAWSLTSGTLPLGLTLNPVTGLVFGTPNTPGSSSATVQVADNEIPAIQTDTGTVAITVSPSGVPPNTIFNGARANSLILH